MENWELRTKISLMENWHPSTATIKSWILREPVSQLLSTNNCLISNRDRSKGSTLSTQEMISTDTKVPREIKLFIKVPMRNKMRCFLRKGDRSTRDIHFWIDLTLTKEGQVSNFPWKNPTRKVSVSCRPKVNKKKSRHQSPKSSCTTS